jgi:hypothetical protein
VNSKALRISLYVLTPLLIARMLSQVWHQTISSEWEPLGSILIVLGLLTILYGWLFIGSVGSEYSELEIQVSQIISFEAGTVLTVAGIVFLVRYSLSS